MEKEIFVKLYEEGYGEEGIAKKLGISVHYARKYILQFGLKKHPFGRLGQKCLSETKEKIAKAHIGKKLSKEHREKVIKTLKYGQKGESNPGWKGGIHIRKDGYVCIRKPEHPRCYSNGYVKRATLVMEKKINRFLIPGEVVHHINGIHDDDREENLALMSDREHNSLTAKERWARGDFHKILPHMKRRT